MHACTASVCVASFCTETQQHKNRISFERHDIFCYGHRFPLGLVTKPFTSWLQMLENANEIILHGFAYKDFLREIPNPQVCLRSNPLRLREARSKTD